MTNRLSRFRTIIKDTFRLFFRNDPLKLGGATAFFTMFALPPVLIILIQFLSLFIDPHSIKHELFINLSGMLGEEAVRQIVSVIKEVRELNSNWLAAILVFTFLIFVATTLFKVIRSSINQIWELEPMPGKKVIASLKSRLLSFGFIIVTGLLFSIAMFIETLQVIVGSYFIKLFPAISGFVNQALAFVIGIFTIATWFTIILRYLNNRHPSWRVAWTGGLVTSILFSIGKIVLHLLLNYNNVNNIYGASASIVLLLLFVFYSAMILYFGAAFTRIWGEYTQNKQEIKSRSGGTPTGS